MCTFSAWTNRKAQNNKQKSENLTINTKEKLAQMRKIISPWHCARTESFTFFLGRKHSLPGCSLDAHSRQSKHSFGASAYGEAAARVPPTWSGSRTQG